MSYNQNRLRFVHCETCFETSKQAREYVNGNLITNDRPSLYAEPMILKYGDPTNPNILLAIGSVGDGITPSVDNKVFFIDCAQLDIDNNFEFINSNTIKFTVTKHESGTTIGTNVLIEEKKNIDEIEYENIITTSENGLFSYVNTEIDGEKLIVNVNGKVKEYTLPSTLTSGEYNKDTLELILTATNGEQIKINFNDVVSISNEEGNIVTKKNDGLYANVELDYITSANTLSFKNSNIGKKYIELQTITSSTTKTIKNQVHIDNKNVQINSDVILSSDEQNIITVADNGLYANVNLDYNKATNTLKFTTTSGQKEIQLSSHSLVTGGMYDPNTKEIVLTITYDSEDGEIVRQIRIPVSDLVNGKGVLLVNNKTEALEIANDENSIGQIIFDVNNLKLYFVTQKNKLIELLYFTNDDVIIDCGEY